MKTITVVQLHPSSNSLKKWMVTFPNNHATHFGAQGYQDYTQHRNPDRKERYITRHRANENWTRSGIETAGFWSRWLLWEKPSLEDAIKNIEKKFDLKIMRAR